MADQDNYKTYVRETRTTEGSGTGMALLVGGLVVAVFFVIWLVFGGPGPGPVTTTEPVSDTTNVTVAPAAEPADTTTNVTIEPAPDATAPAPDAAEPAAPADATNGAAPATPPANP